MTVRRARAAGCVPKTRVGYDFAAASGADHSRLAYVELHDDAKAETVTGFVERALTFYAQHGITAKRPLTDNGFSWSKTAARAHLKTKPYRQRTNGKVERFHQTMPREWAYALTYRTHRHRNTTRHTGSTTTTGDDTPQLTRRPTFNQPRSQRL